MQERADQLTHLQTTTNEEEDEIAEIKKKLDQGPEEINKTTSMHAINDQLSEIKKKFDDRIATIKKYQLLTAEQLREYEEKYQAILATNEARDEGFSALLKSMNILKLTNKLFLDAVLGLTKEKIENIMKEIHQLPNLDITTSIKTTTQQLTQKNKDIEFLIKGIIQGNDAVFMVHKSKYNEFITMMNGASEAISHSPNKAMLKESRKLHTALIDKMQALEKKMDANQLKYIGIKKIHTNDYAFKKPNVNNLNNVLRTMARMYLNAMDQYLAANLSLDLTDSKTQTEIENAFPGLTYKFDKDGGVDIYFKDKAKQKSMAGIMECVMNCAFESNKLINEEQESLSARTSIFGALLSMVTSALTDKKPIEYLYDEYQKLNESTEVKKFVKNAWNISVEANKNYLIGLNRSYFNRDDIKDFKDSLIKIEKPAGDINKLSEELLAPAADHENIAKELASIQSDIQKLQTTIANETKEADRVERERIIEEQKTAMEKAMEEQAKKAKKQAAQAEAKRLAKEAERLAQEQAKQEKSLPAEAPEIPSATNAGAIPVEAKQEDLSQSYIHQSANAQQSVNVQQPDVNQPEPSLTLSEDQKTQLREFLIEQKKRISSDKRIYMSDKSIEAKETRIITYLNQLKPNEKTNINIIQALKDDLILNARRQTIFEEFSQHLSFSIFRQKEATFTKLLNEFCETKLKDVLQTLETIKPTSSNSG